MRWPGTVVRGHVDDCALLGSLTHLRPNKSTHKNYGEGVSIYCSDQVFVTRLVHLAFPLVKHLDIIY